jgi:cell division protein FtsW (lipid II flippase)
MIMLVIPFFRRYFDAMRHLGIVFGAVGIAALAGVLLLSAATNGAQITYTIAGFTFQPSEFVKILYILMLAGMLSGEVTRPKAVFVTFLAVIHVGILVLSRDLGSALIFFVIYLMMLFLATGSWRVIFTGLALGVAGAFICYFLFNHVRVRVEIWRDPFSVIDSMGYQIAQALFAISYGGLWGAGLTQGVPTRIPFVESDFIFAAIAEEMGLIFACCLLLLCINCFLRILVLSAGYSNRFFQLFTFGTAVCYIFQTFLTVGGETKFIPLTGVTLPLVSYGGSSVLSTLIMFGMIEMIFILHDERTARFKARYNQERAGMAAPDGYAAYPGSYAAAPDAYAGMPDAYADVPGGYGDAPADYSYTDNLYDDLPENFPVNGISEEGIFENSGYGDSSTPPAGGAFYQGQDLDRRR